MDLVSIVLAVRNEEKIISNCLKSLLKQRLNEGVELELLVIDGMSDDKTAEIVKLLEGEFPNKVRYILNTQKITPVAFNLGIQNAKGNYIGIFGSHNAYADDYIQTCLSEMKRVGADGCSGTVNSIFMQDNWETELCKSLLSSPIGVTSGSFRNKGEGFADTIPYGIFKKSVFDKVGLYNEGLIRNQDNDMNHRIIKAGFKLYITSKTSTDYFPKQQLKPLLQYAFHSGFWHAKTLLLGSFSLKPMHFIPFFFVLYQLVSVAILCFAIFSKTWSLAIVSLFPILLYFFLVIYFNQKNTFKFKENYTRFLLAVYRFHTSYGWGTLMGFFKK